MSTNVLDILSTSMQDVKRPPVIPVGSYVCAISAVPGQMEPLQSEKGDFQKLTVPLKIVSAYEVDDDLMEDFTSQGGIVPGVPLRLDFIFNMGDDEEGAGKRANTQVRLKEFLEKAGVDTSGSFLDALASCAGAEVLVEVNHRPGQNPEEVYPDIRRVLAVQ